MLNLSRYCINHYSRFTALLYHKFNCSEYTNRLSLLFKGKHHTTLGRQDIKISGGMARPFHRLIILSRRSCTLRLPISSRNRRCSVCIPVSNTLRSSSCYISTKKLPFLNLFIYNTSFKVCGLGRVD